MQCRITPSRPWHASHELNAIILIAMLWYPAAAGVDQGGEDDPDFYLPGLAQNARVGDHFAVEECAGRVDRHQQVEDARIGKGNV